jgi:hypothetical protein
MVYGSRLNETPIPNNSMHTKHWLNNIDFYVYGKEEISAQNESQFDLEVHDNG